MRGVTQSSRPFIPVVLLKEFVYCPRIAFYKYFSVWEPPTESMRAAKGYSKLDLLKLLRSYGVEGDVYAEHPVCSKLLGVCGRADAVVDCGQRLAVVEVKLDTSKSRLRGKAFHHMVQLVAYVIAAEETLRKPVRRAFIAVPSRWELIEVSITPALRQIAARLAEELRRYIEEEKPPPKTPVKSRCMHCFYREVCA